MRLFSTVALVVALAAPSVGAGAAPLAGGPEAGTVPPGSALVALAGDPAIVAVVPVRMSVEHDGFAPRTVLSVGGDAASSPAFAFTLGPVEPIGPLPSTVSFLEQRGVTGAGIAAFVIAERDAQLVMLVPPEVTRAALAAGRMPDLDEVERSIPPEVVADLEYLRERRTSAARTHVSVLVVREPDTSGTVVEHHGLGMVEIRFDDAAAEAGSGGQAHFAGSFWGSFDRPSGPAWLEGRFAGVPFELTTHPLLETERRRWVESSVGPQTSRFEAHWTEPFPIVGFAVAVPQAWDALEHHLNVELLLEPGGWTAVAGTPLPPAAAEAVGPSLDDDDEAVAFLRRVGATPAQFEHLLDLGHGPLMLLSWQAQGIALSDVPPTILERIAAADAAAAPDATTPAQAAPGAASGPSAGSGWTQSPPGFLSHKTLAYRLPEPLLARGVRFELHGAPFLGEHWELRVEAGPLSRPGGEVSHTWRYVHGW